METRDFVNDSVILHTAAGEVEAMYPVALALSRKVGDREQRIMILGDADCISNEEFSYPEEFAGDDGQLYFGYRYVLLAL